MPYLPQPRAILHGSFTRHFEELKSAYRVLAAAGIEIVAPRNLEVVGSVDDFLLLEDEEALDPRYVELRYLQNLRELGENGFSYFVNPDGYIGKSAAYELGVAQLSNVPCYFWSKPTDLPVYVPANHIWTPGELADQWIGRQRLPEMMPPQNELAIHRLWESLMVGGSRIATGGIIEYRSGRSSKYPEILLVKTHKWGGRYSMVGGQVRRNERLTDALAREIHEETGLAARPTRHLVTFDQIKNSGYYRQGVHHVFVDYVAEVRSRRVQLNEEAQDHLWVPAEVALAELEIEPNARHTLELYVASL